MNLQLRVIDANGNKIVTNHADETAQVATAAEAVVTEKAVWEERARKPSPGWMNVIK